MKFHSLILSAVLFLFIATPAQAQLLEAPRKQAPPSLGILARDIAHNCKGSWEVPACLMAISKSNFYLVINYGTKLERLDRIKAKNLLRDHCAAATAQEEDVPAYAYRSAYVDCANMIHAIYENTQVKPDINHYQLLVSSVLCLNKDPRCAAIESQMMQ